MMEDDQEDYGALIYRESLLRKKEAEAAAAAVAMKGTTSAKKKRKRKDSTADDASSTIDTKTKWDNNWQQKFSALQVRFIRCVRYAFYSPQCSKNTNTLMHMFFATTTQRVSNEKMGILMCQYQTKVPVR